MSATIIDNKIIALIDNSAHDPESAIISAFQLPDGSPRTLLCGELLARGHGQAERVIAEVIDRIFTDRPTPVSTEELARRVLRRILRMKPRLTGAEAVAAVLAAAGVNFVFAYPGTSELALCDAVDDSPELRLINGRGDKEAAFMAAGASLLTPLSGVAILHGARGATNACGAIADARRNEVATMFIVGLPSTGSARFLPPHGEPALIDVIDAFAGWSWEAEEVPEAEEARLDTARQFITKLREGLRAAAIPPYQPSLFGVPQDVAEKRWISAEVLATSTPSGGEPFIDEVSIKAALSLLRSAARPLILIDDYALHYPGIRASLDSVSRMIGAPVLQVRYRRGPMLFERLHSGEVKNFVGWLDGFNEIHKAMLDDCDLLITVEDRNIYPRVTGKLPGCRKIGLNSDPEKILKNEYIESSDVIVIGNPALTLSELSVSLRRSPERFRPTWFPAEAATPMINAIEPPSDEVAYGRKSLASAIAGSLARCERPVLVDDSQMFGGLLAEHYDIFPFGTRVFGGHGGFVGAGLSYATGLAIAASDARIICTLGDQAFTNSFQGLVAAVQERARVLFIVCNNGESVSLKKQASVSFGSGRRRYLSNVSGFNYAGVARAIGVPTAEVAIPIGGSRPEVDDAIGRLGTALSSFEEWSGPALIELVLPSDPEVWRGIWITRGFEQAPVEVAH